MTPSATTAWVGNFGEGFVKGILESRGYETVSLQNNSGNGIDVIGVKRKFGRTLLLVVEVKATSGSKPPRLQPAQQDLGQWARSRLRSIADGAGGYRNQPNRDREVGRRLLDLIDIDEKIGKIPAAAIVVDVRGVGRQGPPTAQIRGITRVPAEGVKPRGLHRFGRGRFRPGR